MPSTDAVIFTGGSPPSEAAVASIARDAFVVAADSGYDHARALGVTVHLLIGDLDSISPEGREHATSKHVEIDEHPGDKDFTDTELAVLAAQRRGFTSISVLTGGELDRLDHLLGIIGSAVGAGATCWCGNARVRALDGGGHLNIPARADTATGPWLVSLVPWGGDAQGVSTQGLRWPLDAETLALGSSRGLSNEVVDPADGASISLLAGTLLVIEPEVLE